MGPGVSRFTNWKTFSWAWAFTFALGLVQSQQPTFGQASGNLGSTAASPALAANFTSISPKAKLTLRVYDYAGVDEASLTSSEKVADAIFQNVGIEATWVDCPTSKRKSEAYPLCDSEMGTADLVLRILPRHMAMKLRHSYDSLGYAQTCPESEPGCELTVFYHRVDELAANGYREDRILGYVIAHEVAHVLLGPGHSDEGILRAAWSPSDLQRISLGMHLDFSTDQSKQLRLAVVRRAAAPESVTQASLQAP